MSELLMRSELTREQETAALHAINEAKPFIDGNQGQRVQRDLCQRFADNLPYIFAVAKIPNGRCGAEGSMTDHELRTMLGRVHANALEYGITMNIDPYLAQLLPAVRIAEIQQVGRAVPAEVAVAK